MRPTRCLHDAACLVELVEPRVAIGLQDAPVVPQMSGRMLSFAIRRVG